MGSIVAPYGQCDFAKSCKQLTDKHLRKVLKTRVFAAGCTLVCKYSILVKLTMNKYTVVVMLLHIYACRVMAACLCGSRCGTG